MKCVFLFALVAVTVAGGGWGQPVPVGGEFQVNTYTPDDQHDPAVASDVLGNFVVVWSSSGQDGDAGSIQAQRYSSDGTALGDELQVNTSTADDQALPRVAVGPGGDFIVLWVTQVEDPWPWSTIEGQRFGSDGLPIGFSFEVGGYSIGAGPDVAMDAQGNFVVVWDDSDSILARRFDADGEAIGNEFAVDLNSFRFPWAPAVAAAADGDFVIVWTIEDGSGFDVVGQRYSSDGSAVGEEFWVNTYTADHQHTAAIATWPTGDFVVVWTSSQDGDGQSIHGQRFGSDATPMGGEFQVNSYTTSSQREPAVAIDPGGAFVVAWSSLGQDGSEWSVQGQRFRADGGAIGGEFQINSSTTSSQRGAEVAVDPSGDFVAVWNSDGQDGSGWSIQGQRFRVQESHLTIDDVRQSEGDDGSSWLQFTVARDDNRNPASVEVSTADGSATAGSDYAELSTTVEFAADGDHQRTVEVEILGDATVELDESFSVHLSDPVGALILDGRGEGVIDNDDQASLSILDRSDWEPEAGTRTILFTVTLDQAVDASVSADYATHPGTAEDETGDGDFQSTQGTLVFAGTGGETQTLAVTVNSDTTEESDEAFVVFLSNPQASGRDVVLGDFIALGTIFGEARPDHVFSDGFEAGDLSCWSTSQ